jgi:hypothetical protein
MLALAGCQEKKQAAPSHATAAGEVLPGSASDAMLPIDSVRSQPPLAPKVEPSGKAAKSKMDTPVSPSVKAAEPDTPSVDTPPPAPPAQQ